jgi:D-alanyl-D-alanine carboxypeptidase
VTEPPRYERTTTTPVRGSRPPKGRSPVFLYGLIGVAVLASFLMSRVLSHGQEPLPEEPCSNEPCSIEVVPAVPTAPLLALRKEVTVSPYKDQDPDRWMRQTSVAPPQISGTSAAVIEGSCGRLVYGLRQNERSPPASIAKIVSALVVADNARLTDKVDVKINGWELAIADGSSIVGLEPGMNLTVEELLYGMMLPSGNDAALALADNLGGSRRFVGLMNDKVRRLGLENSRFATVDGRDADDNYTSALDIGLLGRELMANPALRTIAGAKTSTASWDRHTIWNTNYFVYGYPDAIGVKFGYTEGANETVVAAASRNGRELYVSVLSSDFAYLDAVKLMDWAYKNTQPSC